jgi:hypothetical protein
MAREVYDFLEVPTYAGVRLYDIDHAYPAREQLDLVDFANYFFNDRDGLTEENEYKRIVPGATPLPTLAEFNDTLTVPGFDEPQPFATWYNPWMREDYLRFNWKNPNRTKKWTGEIGEVGQSIAANVRQYFNGHPHELIREGTTRWEIDYPASMVEGGYVE